MWVLPLSPCAQHSPGWPSPTFRVGDLSHPSSPCSTPPLPPHITFTHSMEVFSIFPRFFQVLMISEQIFFLVLTWKSTTRSWGNEPPVSVWTHFTSRKLKLDFLFSFWTETLINVTLVMGFRAVICNFPSLSSHLNCSGNDRFYYILGLNISPVNVVFTCQEMCEVTKYS